jgi:hypothetical protein
MYKLNPASYIYVQVVAVLSVLRQLALKLLHDM